LDNIFDQTANVQAASGKIYTLVSEGRKLIHKRQKQLKLLTDAKWLAAWLFKNTNHTSWLPIQRMKRSSRKRKKQQVEKGKQDKRV